MRTVYLIMRGQFYTEGAPFAVAVTKQDALDYLKSNGYTKTRSQPLYESVIDGCSYWARIDPIQEVTCAP